MSSAELAQRVKVNDISFVQQMQQMCLIVNSLGKVVQNLTKLLANVALKFLFWNIADTLIFFAEKMWKATHIFAAKISLYLKIS